MIRLNHVGDWGTQFGMLIHFLKESNPSLNASDGDASASLSLDVSVGDLMEFYRAAKKRFDEDLTFKEAARNEVRNSKFCLRRTGPTISELPKLAMHATCASQQLADTSSLQ